MVTFALPANHHQDTKESIRKCWQCAWSSLQTLLLFPCFSFFLRGSLEKVNERCMIVSPMATVGLGGGHPFKKSRRGARLFFFPMSTVGLGRFRRGHSPTFSHVGASAQSESPFWSSCYVPLGPPVVPFYQTNIFWGEGSPTKIDCSKKSRYLIILTSLEDLTFAFDFWVPSASAGRKPCSLVPRQEAAFVSTAYPQTTRENWGIYPLYSGFPAAV